MYSISKLSFFSTIVFPVPIDIMSSFMQNQQNDSIPQDLHQHFYKIQQQHQQHQALRGHSDVKLLIPPPAQTHKIVRPQQKHTVKVK